MKSKVEEEYIFHTPIGAIQIKSDKQFITEILFLDNPEEKDANVVKDEYPNKLVQQCFTELKEYFEGKRKNFTFPLKPSGTQFEKSVWDKLMEIPFGTTISYEELSLRLGDVNKMRAVGRANGKNPIAIVIPCHRVVGKDGSFTGYAGGLERKRWLLIHEGVIGEQMTFFNN